MKTLQGPNLLLRFILEMTALVILGHWCYETGDGATRWLLVVAAPVAMIGPLGPNRGATLRLSRRRRPSPRG
jgi:hypothetical protein